MRYSMIAMLLCACAPFTSARRLTPAEAEANYREFYRELMAGRYGTAKALADQRKVDKQKVLDVVITAMWQEIMINKEEMGVKEAREISRKFQLSQAVEASFAKNAFHHLIKYRSCEKAASVVFWFNLEPAYADKAIDCAGSLYGPNHIAVARLACIKPGAKDFQRKLITGWIKNFKQTSSVYRDYDLLAEIAAICPLVGGDFSELFAIGMEDKQFKFARAMLNEKDFKKVPVDYDGFIAAAISHFQCGLAATVAIEHELSDDVVEAIFLNPRCFGGTLSEIDLETVPRKKIFWLFDLSLQAREYAFARNLVDKFQLADSYFDRIVDEAIGARDFQQIVDFELPADRDVHLYQDGILDKIMDLNEEWFVVLYAVSKAEEKSDKNWHGWVERAYLHALRRGAFELAAGVAEKHEQPEFGRWGIKLAFESACEANLKEAGEIARRWLDRQAWRRVVLLVYQKKREEEIAKKRKKRIELLERTRRACADSDDWCVEQAP